MWRALVESEPHQFHYPNWLTRQPFIKGGDDYIVESHISFGNSRTSLLSHWSVVEST